jgi:hypothetical protein
MNPRSFVLMVILASSASAADIVAISTFDSGLDGWAPIGRTCALTNPGGYLHIQDVDNDWARPLAPLQFTGDWRSVGRVSFDIRPDATAPLGYSAAVRVKNAQGATSEFEFPMSATPIGVWSTVSVRIGPGAGNWNIPAALRAGVTEFSLRIDMNNKSLDGGTIEFNDVDNVTLWGACPADLNVDGVVDDEDFVLFLFAYNLLDCGDPSMAAGCPADINRDGFVDDSDFVLFLAGYNELICP